MVVMGPAFNSSRDHNGLYIRALSLNWQNWFSGEGVPTRHFFGGEMAVVSLALPIKKGFMIHAFRKK